MSAGRDDESWRGKIGGMSADEIDRFLNEPFLARVACLDDNDWPYVVPCWYQWDGAALCWCPAPGPPGRTTSRRVRAAPIDESSAADEASDSGCSAASWRSARPRSWNAQCRRPLGGGRPHHVAPPRPPLSRAHHALEALAGAPRSRAHPVLARHRLAQALPGGRRRRPLSGQAPGAPCVSGRVVDRRWRMGWDSNPRGTRAPAGFQDRCLRPLGHPSAARYHQPGGRRSRRKHRPAANCAHRLLGPSPSFYAIGRLRPPCHRGGS